MNKTLACVKVQEFSDNMIAHSESLASAPDHLDSLAMHLRD
jgi:hypothetical protein